MFEPSNPPARLYQTPVNDATRWEAFRPRDDDVLICTAYKSGTTWMQRICSLIIFQTATLDRPMSRISPWLEIRADPLEQVIATYEAQTHRRFIKTHTPLDGLPWRDATTYLAVIRDPRDVFMSLVNHLKNFNVEGNQAEFVKEMRASGEAREPMPVDPNILFEGWITQAAYPWQKDGAPYGSIFHHAQSFWENRHRPNIHLFHYSDMKADLGAEMRRVAEALGIEVPEALWPELIEAATFDAMKANSAQFAPESHLNMWKSTDSFFNKGASGQWQDVISAENLTRLDAHLAEHYPPEMIEWMRQGSAAKTR